MGRGGTGVQPGASPAEHRLVPSRENVQMLWGGKQERLPASFPAILRYRTAQCTIPGDNP
jgi:hypothetical protein